MSALAFMCPLLFGRFRVPFPVVPDGLRKTEARAVGYRHLVLPREPVPAGNQVAHEGVGAVLRPALHRDITAVAELVDIVLHAPAAAGFAHEVGTNLGGDDLVGAAGLAMSDDAAVEIDDHR